MSVLWDTVVRIMDISKGVLYPFFDRRGDSCSMLKLSMP